MPKEDGLAYDGSNRPQDRPLTAWERDVVTRVLSDYLNTYRFGVNIMRPPEHSEVGMLLEVRKVLDPREE